jgi:hypothetical protein
MATTTRTVGWSHEDVDYRVECSFTPGEPARGPDLNGPGEPGCGPEVEILRVTEDAPRGAERPDLLDAAQADFDLIEERAVEKAGDDEDSARDSAEQLAVDCARDEQRLGC